ncbi:MAG TPA: nucleotidyltransferase [Prevotellaceae bacterium]|nr:nucleotidyltransferase domain-containing protein [Bacteroidaceae bacterium]HAE24908.1 nucleotidyltransferase [Prevotellaceae bacterium]
MSTSDIKLLLSGYFKDKPVNKVWLFGSYARGEENTDSDIDLMIDLDHSQPVGLKFFGMWNDLESLLGRDVDLVTEEGLADYARESYNRDKILIYERNC